MQNNNIQNTEEIHLNIAVEEFKETDNKEFPFKSFSGSGKEEEESIKANINHYTEKIKELEAKLSIYEKQLSDKDQHIINLEKELKILHTKNKHLETQKMC